MHAMCFAISTNSVASCAAILSAILAQSMRAQHASNTTARANYHPRLPSFKRLAIAWSDMRLATQTIKPAVRGAHGTCL